MPMVFVPVGTENRRVGSRDMVMMIQGQVDQQQEGGNIICSDGPRDCFQFISSSSSLLADVLCVLSMRLEAGTIWAGLIGQIPCAYHCQGGGTLLSIFYVHHSAQDTTTPYRGGW